MRAALVKDGVVHNVIVVSDDFDLPEWGGYMVVLSDEAEMEDTYDGKAFTRAIRPAPPPPVKSELELLKERVAALEAKLPREQVKG